MSSTASFSMPTQSTTGKAIVVIGVEGIGKTTLGAFAPGSKIIMSPQERGYQTLFDAGRVPAVPRATAEKWGDVFAIVDRMIGDGDGENSTLVLDAMGGLERMCHESVCEKEFDGDWGERGFLSYHKGYELGVQEWVRFLVALDRLRDAGTDVILLAHSRIEPFSNPLGADYHRFGADCHRKTWGVTHKWADAVLFYTFLQVVKTEKRGDKKGKAVGGKSRVLHTEHCDLWDAKNRYGMDSCVAMPDDPSQSYAAMMAAIHNHTTKGAKP